MVYLIYFFQWFARSHWFGAVNTAGRLDCEQSLFFLRFSEGSARSRECRAARNEVGIPRRKKVSLFSCLFRLAPSVKRVVICVSRAFYLTDKKKERPLVVYRGVYLRNYLLFSYLQLL